jgi:hypothetical protein
MQFLIDVALTLIYLFAFLLVCAWAWRFWILYVNQKHTNSISWVMLEIKLPREIMKSPFAMETALASLLQTGGIGNWWARNFKGALAAYSSVEIASLEGVIHFYVRIQKKFRPLVESNLYAQYPGIEISEAEDYTNLIRYHHLSKDVSAWGATYSLSKSWNPTNPKTGEAYPKGDGKYSMKADFLPLKTYVDYGLDKDPKEEFKIDPITALLEFMGSIGKGEYFWFQVLVQDESIYNGKKLPKFFLNKMTGKRHSLSELADERKKQIRTQEYILKGSPMMNEFGDPKEKPKGKDDEGKPIMVPALHPKDKIVPKKEMDLTKEEKDQLEAINEKLSKPLALTVTRLMYVAKKDAFKTEQIQNIISFPKPYVGENSFGLSPTDPYDYPWQNFLNRRVPWRTEEMFEAFVKREGFFPLIDKREDRDTIHSWEDNTFWSSSMKSRRVFRMLWDTILHPFTYPQPSDVSVMNLEELATLWHFPGAVATTPTLPRIDSTKGVAPVNLPR